MLALLLACETDGNSLFNNWTLYLLSFFFFLDTEDAMNYILLLVISVKEKVGSATWSALSLNTAHKLSTLRVL